MEVLKSIARGLSTQEIASELHISVNTVRTHVKHLYDKLGLKNRAQATMYALEHGLTS